MAIGRPPDASGSARPLNRNQENSMFRILTAVSLLVAPLALSACVNVEKAPPSQVVVQPAPAQPAPPTTVIVPAPPQ
jgi:hypothetical protein